MERLKITMIFAIILLFTGVSMAKETIIKSEKLSPEESQLLSEAWNKMRTAQGILCNLEHNVAKDHSMVLAPGSEYYYKYEFAGGEIYLIRVNIDKNGMAIYNNIIYTTNPFKPSELNK